MTVRRCSLARNSEAAMVNTAAVATFCLLHGAWHDPCCWGPLVARLHGLGHRALAPDLPFHDPRSGFRDRVAPALDALQDARGPVVIVAHSMASTYAPLVAAERADSLLVHLCARLGSFAPPSDAPRMFRPGIPFPHERPDGSTMWEAKAAIEVLYRRLPAATALALASRLRSLAPAVGEYPLCAHPEVASALIYAACDELFEPAWQRLMATAVLGTEPIEVPGGHFPMLENTEMLAHILDRLAPKA
jgi:Alpha/beta hydrolase family